MFKLDDKEYDETKLSDKGKFSFAQLQTLGQKKNAVLADLNNLDVLVSHYSSILQEEVKVIGLQKEEEVKKES